MAPGPGEDIEVDDPALAAGEWLFRRRGEVFGPVPSRDLAALLYRGEIDGATPVSPGDGRWRPVTEVPAFRVHVKKAEAALRVEREVTGARLLRQRRTRRKAVAAGVLAAALVAGGIAAGLLLAPRREASGLTEDFGGGITLSARAQVGLSGRADDGEIEIPLDAPSAPPASAGQRRQAGAGERPARAAGPSTRGGVAQDGDGLVEQRFDGARIQSVVQREQRSLVPCFREEAQRTPEFEGEVPFEFAVGNDGKVAKLWIDDPRFKGGALEQCLWRALSAWRFDPFPGQRPTVQLAFRIGR